MNGDSEWNGLRIPPRPPLPVPRAEPTLQDPPAPSAEVQAAGLDAEAPQTSAAPVRRIGMPPGMDVSPDTVPSSDHAAPVPVRRPEFPVAPTPIPPAASSLPSTAAAPAPVTAPAPVAVAPANPRLVLPDGAVLPFTHGLFVGRDPQEQDGYGVTGRARLHDVERSVSKTHALLGVSEGRVWVIDLNSTNGTTMIAPDGAETPCTPEVATPIPAGTDLRFGEYRVQVVVD